MAKLVSLNIPVSDGFLYQTLDSLLRNAFDFAAGTNTPGKVEQLRSGQSYQISVPLFVGLLIRGFTGRFFDVDVQISYVPLAQQSVVQIGDRRAIRRKCGDDSMEVRAIVCHHPNRKRIVAGTKARQCVRLDILRGQPWTIVPQSFSSLYQEVCHYPAL